MIEIDGVTKAYDGQTVVDDVTIKIPPHTVTVIVGTSGSGKTTLLRMINRLVEPTSGAIRIDGEDIRGIPGHELRRRIGYAIQGHGLFPHKTVAQNIATVPHLLRWDRSRIDRKVDDLLHLFQLDPGTFARRFPHELSGGQQQRIGVARALAAEPNILLMDEPFGALDPIIRAKAQADLTHIQELLRTTIVLVTHDMDEAFHLAHRIAVMDGGRIVQEGTPVDLVTRPATEFVETLIGTEQRSFRLLAIGRVFEALEEGPADGEPILATASQRDALSRLLWTGQPALPVMDAEGRLLGRITLAGLSRRVAGER